ncbi:MAG: hypothetical protein QT03_C0001G0548 [archaeon GW2011_AR10]|uniref:Uncharacterized protein n=1 Tax=Candidatus Iainarchaeum sp. TaxID=3101447 RepID=A0A7J4IWE9_9ARCH|nr:MAG: hypothetical protein QT03_C0001G0548 [archaeon GW2011_AR10]HIH08585.1 hypothetical protein [Candidatus Diapherotrites archaeon]
MKNKKQPLSVLLSNNWLFHDKKKYNLIEENSINLLIELGYNESSSKKAGKLIKKLYEFADKIQKIDLNTYEKMNSLCDKIDHYLKRNKNAKNEIKWWKAVRDKNYFLATYFIFLDQLSKLGWKNAFLSIKATKQLYRAGIEHDKKNWQAVQNHCQEYWKIIKRAKVDKFIEF